MKPIKVHKTLSVKPENWKRFRKNALEKDMNLDECLEYLLENKAEAGDKTENLVKGIFMKLRNSGENPDYEKVEKEILESLSYKHESLRHKKEDPEKF